MLVIYNKIIPFRGYKAINLFGVIFVRSGCWFSNYDLNHEQIHTKQIIEMLYIFFYIWYIIEFLIRLVYVIKTYPIEDVVRMLITEYLLKEKHMIINIIQSF